MKKFLLIFLYIAYSHFTVAQTAVNFTSNDCDGNSHTLFNELDSGKVIVLCWVMPCGACAGPAQTAFNMVQNYQVTYPGKVQFYLCDDYANSSCTTIDNWATSLGISPTNYSHYFSNSAINMLDYGATGMPKTVVLGGTSHTVFYNVNNTINASALQSAINLALTATGLESLNKNYSNFLIAPNPARSEVEIKFQLDKNTKVQIELYTIDGKLAKQLYSGFLAAGEHKITADINDCANGEYLCKFTGAGLNSHQNLVIIK